MKGLGTDEDKLISILGNRSPENIARIREEYEKAYNRSLMFAIESETSSDFRRLLLAVVTPKEELKANYLFDAIAGIGTKDAVLIDVLTQSSNAEIEAIRKVYAMKFFGKKPRKKSGFATGGPETLENDIKDDTSGDFERILLACLSAKRDESPQVNDSQAAQDAEDLYKAGEGKLGTDDTTFINLFSHRSVAHLQAVDKHYRAKHNHGLDVAVDKETSGNYKKALLALLKPREVHYADRIREAVQGLGTDDSLLIYTVCINNHKDDWKKLTAQYKAKFNRDLAADIASDTSRDYKKLLLAIIAHLNA